MSTQDPKTTSRDSARQSNTQKRSGRTTPDTIPFAQRLTCTIPEACKATGLGRTKLYELIGGGYLDTITIGRRRLVRVTSLLSIVAPASSFGFALRHRRSVSAIALVNPVKSGPTGVSQTPSGPTNAAACQDRRRTEETDKV